MKKLIIIGLLLSITAFAAEFSINTLTGNAKYQKNGKGDWIAVTKATKFEKADMIKLDAGAHLNLIHSTGNPLELNKSGVYSIAKLAAKANTKKSDVTKKFTKYLLDELGDSDDLLAEGNLQDNMTTLGAVERAIPKFSPNEVNVGLPRSSYTLNNQVSFNWYPFKDATTYKFILKDDLEEVVLEKELTGTSINVDLSTFSVTPGMCYYWSIEANGQKSEEFCINLMSDQDKTNFQNELNTLSADVDPESALGNMILASFYSEKKLVNEAIESYEKALKISPENDNYKLIYGKYLMSIGLVNEAQELASK